MTVLPFPTSQSIPPAAPLNALTLCRNYFTQVYPARGHGATDCGEYMDGSAGLPDGDHFLGWLWERGFKVVSHGQ